MFDDFVYMIPRAFGYTMSKSFYKYLENNKNKDLLKSDDKSLKESKKNEEKNNPKYVNLGYTKTF